MRFLQAVLKFSQVQNDDRTGHSLMLENRVRVLTQTRSWYLVPHRRTVIKNHQLPAWYRGSMRCATRAPQRPPTRWPITCSCCSSQACAAVAEGLDIAGYTLKCLLNHTIHGDVMAGYIVTDVERLRDPMERISRFLCSAMGMGEPSNVVPLTNPTLPASAILRETLKTTR